MESNVLHTTILSKTDCPVIEITISTVRWLVRHVAAAVARGCVRPAYKCGLSTRVYMRALTTDRGPNEFIYFVSSYHRGAETCSRHKCEHPIPRVLPSRESNCTQGSVYMSMPLTCCCDRAPCCDKSSRSWNVFVSEIYGKY